MRGCPFVPSTLIVTRCVPTTGQLCTNTTRRAPIGDVSSLNEPTGTPSIDTCADPPFVDRGATSAIDRPFTVIVPLAPVRVAHRVAPPDAPVAVDRVHPEVHDQTVEFSCRSVDWTVVEAHDPTFPARSVALVRMA